MSHYNRQNTYYIVSESYQLLRLVIVYFNIHSLCSNGDWMNLFSIHFPVDLFGKHSNWLSFVFAGTTVDAHTTSFNNILSATVAYKNVCNLQQYQTNSTPTPYMPNISFRVNTNTLLWRHMHGHKLMCTWEFKMDVIAKIKRINTRINNKHNRENFIDIINSIMMTRQTFWCVH